VDRPAVQQRKVEIARKREKQPDLLHARIGPARRDRFAVHGDLRPFSRCLEPGELGELGHQAHIAFVGGKQPAGQFAQIAGLLRLRHETRDRNRHGLDRVERRFDTRGDAPVGEVRGVFGERARQQHVEARELHGISRSHQRLDLGGAVEFRRQSMRRRDLQFGKQRLGLGLRPGVAHPYRLEAARRVEIADFGNRRIGAGRAGIGLPRGEQMPDRRADRLVFERHDRPSRRQKQGQDRYDDAQSRIHPSPAMPWR
jgi:hypothetical protein